MTLICGWWGGGRETEGEGGGARGEVSYEIFNNGAHDSI